MINKDGSVYADIKISCENSFIMLVHQHFPHSRFAALTTTGMKSVFACFVSLFVLPVLANAEPFIVKNGQPQAEIVIAENSKRMQQLAANELQSYVAKISGAKLPVVSQPTSEDGFRIFIGASEHTEKLKLSTEDLRHGAYRVAGGQNWIAILGSGREFEPKEPWARSRTRGSGGRAERDRLYGEWDKITGETYGNPFHFLYPYWHDDLQVWEFDDAGTLNGVYDFLRLSGVRWYLPGELGEIVPASTNIAVPQDWSEGKVVRPDFAVRNISWWSRGRSMTSEEYLWNLRLGLNPAPDLIGLTQLCHGSKFVHAREEYKAANPEHFAMFGGKRALDHKGTQGAPCLSSEGFFAHHLKYSRAVFDHYDEPMISIDVCDGYSRGVCQCPLCKDKGTPERGWFHSMSGYVHGYMQKVATELAETHPDKMVSSLSYGAYRSPPEKIDTFPSNLAVWLCQSRKAFHNEQDRAEILDVRDAWLEKLPSKKVFIYDYYTGNRPGAAWSGIPIYSPRLIAEDLRSLKGISLGESIDSYQPHERGEHPYDYLAIAHLDLYITTRLWWDADRDVDALLEDYYTNFFGPARDQMKTFIEYSEKHWPDMRTKASAIGDAQQLLATACKAAGDDIYGQRIEIVVRYMEPLELLRQQLLHPRDQGVPEARAVERPATALKVDGKLDEPFWETVRLYHLFDIESGDWPDKTVGTSFRIAWLGDSLCLGITCREPEMTNMPAATTKKDDLGIWSGDVIEILLETQFHKYYQIAVNAEGVVTDLDRETKLETRWSSGAEVATHRSEDHWTVEIRLPAAGEDAKEIDPLTGISGRRPSKTYPWFLNVCRQRIRGGETQLFAWSPTGERRFNVPKKFGKVYEK